MHVTQYIYMYIYFAMTCEKCHAYVCITGPQKIHFYGYLYTCMYHTVHFDIHICAGCTTDGRHWVPSPEVAAELAEKQQAENIRETAERTSQDQTNSTEALVAEQKVQIYFERLKNRSQDALDLKEKLGISFVEAKRRVHRRAHYALTDKLHLLSSCIMAIRF